ncbi:hypothetical protein NQ317_004268 [Molorchus minor]|uniref:SWIM-type domain-containing protein n=1 Tax=Molorchus minor TaxID=1323400 RepID=A0ABQ9K2A0_9CUCU|nr:hypothetical protein NQ317_004268 [Molorchus minor]
MLKPAIENTLKDPCTKEFGIYFLNEYVKCVESWAYCYRVKCGLNTNMHLERMHKTIKYVYFQGKNNKRLDKMLNVLMKFVRDRLYDRIITLHKVFVQIMEIIFILCKKNCEECNCNLRCMECKTCIHIFSCSCVDYTIKWNMCKHIHLLCRFKEKSVGGLQNDSNLHESNNMVNSPESLSATVTKLKEEYLAILDKIKTAEGIQIAQNYLKSLGVSIEASAEASTLSTVTLTRTSVEKAPANKRIIPQRLFSTRNHLTT